ncbi:MAG: uncharacterized membrane protein YoaK (UPF0700 family) [Parvicella sp.]|jgi:uncharacterized membrane protein YoaK (UPF0700 family)
MNTLHESEIGKNRKIAGYVLSIIPTLMILMAGITKIMGVEEMSENFSKLPNWEDKMVFIGVLEILIIALYWIPKTMNMGFFLMLGFMGGALLAEVIINGGAPIPAIMVTTLFYVGTMLRKPSLSGLGI